MVSKERKDDILLIADNVHRIVMNDDIDNENLATYLRSVNIGVFSTKLDKTDIDAYITYNHDKKRPEIFVDESQNPRRQVFSIAHELGHLVLHWKFVPSIDGDQKYFKEPEPVSDNVESLLIVNYRRQDGYSAEQREAEYEANYFAADFLVPEEDAIEFLKNYVGLDLSDAELIKRMKANYFISEDTARIQLDKLKEYVNV